MNYPYLYTDDVQKRFELKAGKLSGSTPQAREFFIYPDVLDFQNPASVAAFIGRTRILGQPLTPIPGYGQLVVAKGMRDRYALSITRTKDYFGFNGGPGLMLVDCDMKHKLAHYRPLTELGLPSDILRVEYPSSSSWISHNGQWLSQGSGQHVVIAVDDVREIPAITEALYLRSWLAGCGYVLQAKNAALHDRSYIDKSVGSPERFVYGAPELRGDLQRPVMLGQVSGWRPLRLFEIDLDRADRLRVAETIEQALNRARQSPEYRALRHDYARRTQAPGETLDMALLRVDRMASVGQLPPFHVITTCDGPRTVRDIYHDFDRYYDTELADPLEPEYGGGDSRIAKFIRLAGFAPAIYSHSHGGQEWLLMPATVAVGGLFTDERMTMLERYWL